MVLSAEDFERYNERFMPPKNDRASCEQELANKCMEQTKLENQLKHYNGVVADHAGKLERHQVIISDLQEQHRAISEDIVLSSG